MVKKIFVNLPVRALDASKAFFAALGFDFEERFTDATAACLIVGDDLHVMLLTEPKFREFTAKPVADARATTEVLTALALDSRTEVDRLVAAAVAAGGREPREPQDLGFMYSRSFEDPDGHIWEPFWMDSDHLQA